MSVALTTTWTKLQKVKIEQCPAHNVYGPRPLDNGFANGQICEVLAVSDYSESAEGQVMVADTEGRMWFLSTRDVRFVRMEE